MESHLPGRYNLYKKGGIAMIYFDIAYRILGALAIIYVIFNLKDFLKSWGSWILLLGKGIWNGIKWAYNKIISIFKKG